jgi:hypothetical protein
MCLSTITWRLMGEQRYSSTVLDLSTRWEVSGQLTLRPLYPRRMSPQYSLERRLCSPQSRSGRRGKERNLLPCQESNPGRPVSHPWLYRQSSLLGIRICTIVTYFMIRCIESVLMYYLYRAYTCKKIRVHLLLVVNKGILLPNYTHSICSQTWRLDRE